MASASSVSASSR